MGPKKPLFLKVETASITESQISSFRPGATASVSLQSFSGDLKLVSNSYQEYKFTEQGLHKTAKQQPSSAARFYEISDKDVEILEPLGEGASATVYKGYVKAKDCFVAVKCINCMEKEKRKQIMNDIRGLSDVSHPALVQFIGAYRVPDKGQVSIVMEYLDGGSLADLIKKKGSMPEAVIAEIAAQTLEGLIYLHKHRHTVHRDIKPANLLLSSDGRVKIADFGISAFVDNTLAVCNTFLGTVTYMSPERINSQPYSFAADIWSLGLTLLECAMGKYPYDATAGPLVLMMQVLKEEVPMPEEGLITPELHNFLLKCLCKDPFRRTPAEALLSHPFIAKGADRGVLKEFLKDHPQEEADSRQEVDQEEMRQASIQEALQIVDRQFDALSAGSKELERLQGDFTADAVLVHEGVESRGRKHVLGRLRSICDLQVALGAHHMVVDLKHTQIVQGCEVLVHVAGHIEVMDSGPLGAALWGQQQVSHFAGAFELKRQESGQLGIQTMFFRHL